MGFAEARKAAGYSQSDVARLMEVSVAAVSLWETGKNMPTAANLLKMARLYGRTVEELMRPNSGDERRTI